MILVITACSSNEERLENNQGKIDENKQTRDMTNLKKDGDVNNQDMQDEPIDLTENLLDLAPADPKNLEEILNYPVGPLAGKDSNEEIEEMIVYVKEKLPPIEEEKDQAYLEQWWRAYSYLFSEDYPDPNNIIRMMNMEQFGNPNIEDERFHFKENMNVLVILDVSGSMANEINGKSMMDIAKDSINDFVSDLPEDVNIGLRVYGHEGKRTGKTKEESCQSTELVYDIQPLNKQEFKKVIEPFEPTGWTPIGLSLEKVKEDFADYPSDRNTNLVYVVSDGAETCGGDPVKAAEDLVDSNIEPIINVIGFNVDIEGQSHLREIAEAGGGVYTNAGNEEQLQETFKQAEEVLKKWDEWKRGASHSVLEQRSQLRVESDEFFSEWSRINWNESNNIRAINSKLLSEKYITKQSYDYNREKVSERSQLYKNIKREWFKKLKEKIDENYEKLLQDINKEYEDGTK